MELVFRLGYGVEEADAADFPVFLPVALLEGFGTVCLNAAEVAAVEWLLKAGVGFSRARCMCARY